MFEVVATELIVELTGTDTVLVGWGYVYGLLGELPIVLMV